MIKIGITGGIGSGKSYVSHLLEKAGIPVYDTDTEAKKLTLSHPRIREGLLALLGEEVYKADGSLNKPVLASYLFASAENAGRVNRIIHPCVHEDFQQWADRQAASGTEVVAMESAILFESGFHAIVDYVCDGVCSLGVAYNAGYAAGCRYGSTDKGPYFRTDG